MKKSLIIFFVLAGLALRSALGQGFVNLDFESARLVPGPGFYVTTNLLPGWTAFQGTNQLSMIANNAFGGVYTTVALVSNIFNGNFCVGIAGNGSISQTALVPDNAISLLFDVMAGVSPQFAVFLGGQDVSYISIGDGVTRLGHSYTIYGADISAFAGQVETLTFSGGIPGHGGGMLDDIQFSDQPIPEPSANLLFLLTGGVLVLFNACRRRKIFAKDKIFDRGWL
jgi:hypothetical protein